MNTWEGAELAGSHVPRLKSARLKSAVPGTVGLGGEGEEQMKG